MFGETSRQRVGLFVTGQLPGDLRERNALNLIGTTYGGDCKTTFALPNLQSRLPLHQGPGFVLGQVAGVESVTLTHESDPSHSHVPHARPLPPNRVQPMVFVGGNSAGNDQIYANTAPLLL